jgi:gamma-glutamylcysteine synthetase
LQREVAEKGLDGHFGGLAVMDVALQLVALAKQGLYSLGDSLASSVLDPVEEALNEGLSPAALLVKQIGNKHGRAILDATAYRAK